MSKIIVEGVVHHSDGKEVIAGEYAFTGDDAWKRLIDSHDLLKWRDRWARTLLGPNKTFVGGHPETVFGHWTDHQKAFYLRVKGGLTLTKTNVQV